MEDINDPKADYFKSRYDESEAYYKQKDIQRYSELKTLSYILLAIAILAGICFLLGI